MKIKQVNLVTLFRDITKTYIIRKKRNVEKYVLSSNVEMYKFGGYKAQAIVPKIDNVIDSDFLISNLYIMAFINE
jgi:hypothetical protein